MCDWLAIPDNWLLAARAVWLAGAVALVAYAAKVDVHAEYPQGMWIWMAAGLLLTRAGIQHFFPLVAAYVVRGLLLHFSEPSSSLASQPVNSLALGLIFTAAVMTVNMYRANTNQHQFS